MSRMITHLLKQPSMLQFLRLLSPPEAVLRVAAPQQLALLLLPLRSRPGVSQRVVAHQLLHPEIQLPLKYQQSQYLLCKQLKSCQLLLLLLLFNLSHCCPLCLFFLFKYSLFSWYSRQWLPTQHIQRVPSRASTSFLRRSTSCFDASITSRFCLNPCSASAIHCSLILRPYCRC